MYKNGEVKFHNHQPAALGILVELMVAVYTKDAEPVIELQLVPEANAVLEEFFNQTFMVNPLEPDGAPMAVLL